MVQLPVENERKEGDKKDGRREGREGKEENGDRVCQR